MATDDKEFLIRVKADIKQAEAELKAVTKAVKDVSASAKKTGDDSAAGMDKATNATMKWHQFIKGKMGPLMKKFSAEGKSHAEAHTLAIRQIAAEWKKYKATAVSANKAVGASTEKSSKSTKAMAKSFQLVTRAAAAYLSIRTVSFLIKQADAFNVLNVRIKTATKDTGDYVSVQRELFNITQQNGAEFATTVSLFQGLARTAPELQATNSEILKLVNTVEQLGIISGASQAAQRAGLLQFSQGLAGGVFRAEEFNSILENLPEIAARLAKGMGLSVGELRKMVLEGKLLSKDVFDTLLKQAEEINAEFKDIPESIVRSTTTMTGAFSRFLSLLDSAAEGTGTIAEIFQLVAESLNNYSDRLEESDFDELTRKRQEASDKYIFLLDRGAKKESLAIKELLALIDKYDARIISINKNKIKIDAFNNPDNPDFIGPTQPAVELFTPEEIKQQKDAIKQEKARVKSLEKLNAAIKDQGAAYGKTAEEIALYRLKNLGASKEQIDIAKATFATMRAQKQIQETTAEGAKVYQETRTEMELLANELSRLNKLYEAGAFGAVGSAEAIDTLARATFDAEDKFNSFEESGTDAFAGLEAATRGWGDEFTNTLADMVKNGKLNFSSLADSIISDLLRIMIYQQITAPLFGGLGFSGFGATVKHAGGFAGSGPKRNVNPLLFAGAKRYHSGGFPGLRSDEVPAILQKGELVLSKKQVASSVGGGGATRVEIVNRGTPGQVDSASVVPDPRGDILRIVLDDLDRGGALRDRIKTVSNE